MKCVGIQAVLRRGVAKATPRRPSARAFFLLEVVEWKKSL